MKHGASPVPPVRARALARLKSLAAAGATGVLASCGYTVVDPLPPPSCIETPKPTATARFITGDAGDRLVEVTITYAQAVTVSSVRGTEPSGALVNVEAEALGETIVARFSPATHTSVTLDVAGTCAGQIGHLGVDVSIAADSVTASVR